MLLDEGLRALQELRGSPVTYLGTSVRLPK